MKTTLASVLLLASTAAAQSVMPPFNASWSIVDLGVVVSWGNYGGVAFRYDDPNVLLFGEYNSGLITAWPVLRDALGYATGLGAPNPFASVAGPDGGLAYGPGNVLFHTDYGNHALGQVAPGSTVDNRVIPLAPYSITPSVGGCTFVPAGRPGAGHLKLTTWSAGDWFDVTLVPDATGTYSIATVGPPIALQHGLEGAVYPPAAAPLLGGNAFVLVCEWSEGNIAAYTTDANGDPIASTRQLVVGAISGPAGGTVDPVSGDLVFSSDDGHLYALRSVASCGSMTNYGQGTPGLNGVPTITGSGCARIGQSISLQVGNGRPGTLGIMALGFWRSSAWFGPLPILTSTNTVFTHWLDAAGGYRLNVPIPVDPVLGNMHACFQAGYLDAAGYLGFAVTDAVEVVIR